jgi:hypothetical protein
MKEKEELQGYIAVEDVQVPVKAMRANTGKRKWGLMNYKAMEVMIRVLEKGAIKYAANNWMKPMDRQELLECLQRHTAALMDGEEIDADFQENHIGNVLCNAMFYSFHFVLSDEEREKIRLSKGIIVPK